MRPRSSAWSKAGPFAQLPGLRVVVTALAFGGVALATSVSGQSRLPSGTIDLMRKHVCIDTMWAQPALLRASIDLLGIDNVIAGSDWPIVDGPFGAKLTGAMRQANLSGDEQTAVVAGNCRRLLAIT
jgi:hypothetical protein